MKDEAPETFVPILRMYFSVNYVQIHVRVALELCTGDFTLFFGIKTFLINF